MPELDRKDDKRDSRKGRQGKGRDRSKDGTRRNFEREPRKPLSLFEHAVIKAKEFSENNRPKIDESLLGVRKYPGTGKKTYASSEIANDRADENRYEMLFADTLNRMTKAERELFEKRQESSLVLEMVLTESARKIFGDHAQVVLPTKHDDFKNATDAVIVFTNDAGDVISAIAIDFATEQDLDGYKNKEGELTKGIKKKMSRSFQGIADDDENLQRLKYLTITKHGKRHTQCIDGIPRVVIGLSYPEIKRIGELWASGKLNTDTEPALKALAQSTKKQLLRQWYMAKVHNKEKAKESLKKAILYANGAVNTKELKEFLKKTTKESYQDSVLDRIHAELKKPDLDTIYEGAKHDAEKNKNRTHGVGPQWHKDIKDTPMNEEEWKKFDASLESRKINPEVKKHVVDFLDGKRVSVYSWYLPFIAAAVPTRIWMRLLEGAEKSATDLEELAESEAAFKKEVATFIPAKNRAEVLALYDRTYTERFPRIAKALTHKELQSIFPRPEQDRHLHVLLQRAIFRAKGFYALDASANSVIEEEEKKDETKKVVQDKLPPAVVIPNLSGKQTHSAEKAASAEHHEPGTFAHHMAALQKQTKMTKEQYGKYDTRWKRVKSWIGEKVGTLFGAQAGAYAGGMLAWCAGALALPVTIAGAALGGFLMHRYMRNKGMDPTSRMRVAVLQRLAQKMEAEPSYAAVMMRNPQALEAYIKNQMLMRRLGSALVFAGIGGLATATMFQYRTNGLGMNEIAHALRTGDWSTVWGLTYCEPHGRGAQELVQQVQPQGKGGGMTREAYLYNQEQLRMRREHTLTVQEHLRAIRRCQNPYGMRQFAEAFGPGGSRQVPSMIPYIPQR